MTGIERHSDTWITIKRVIHERMGQHSSTLAILGQSERTSDECRGALRELDFLLGLEEEDIDAKVK